MRALAEQRTQPGETEEAMRAFAVRLLRAGEQKQDVSLALIQAFVVSAERAHKVVGAVARWV
jgi:hypothetical protein